VLAEAWHNCNAFRAFVPELANSYNRRPTRKKQKKNDNEERLFSIQYEFVVNVNADYGFDGFLRSIAYDSRFNTIRVLNKNKRKIIIPFTMISNCLISNATIFRSYIIRQSSWSGNVGKPTTTSVQKPSDDDIAYGVPDRANLVRDVSALHVIVSNVSWCLSDTSSVMTSGWFWRVTVGGGGGGGVDRTTQWPGKHRVCARARARVCSPHKNGLSLSDSRSFCPPPERVLCPRAGEEYSVGNRDRNYSHTHPFVPTTGPSSRIPRTYVARARNY